MDMSYSIMDIITYFAPLISTLSPFHPSFLSLNIKNTHIKKNPLPPPSSVPATLTPHPHLPPPSSTPASTNHIAYRTPATITTPHTAYPRPATIVAHLQQPPYTLIPQRPHSYARPPALPSPLSGDSRPYPDRLSFSNKNPNCKN
ncbi:hypothetical protein RND81_07G148500 [Saponaria officinalis]|uniref:Uncharacterized protein n=1 Tax=Saponaria officinalis TaxID=3572 RepID=A0AAW1JUQ6_SAPOF